MTKDNNSTDSEFGSSAVVTGTKFHSLTDEIPSGGSSTASDVPTPPYTSLAGDR